jgi:hypothetical protein
MSSLLPTEPPSPKSAPHDAAPATIGPTPGQAPAQIDLPPGLEPPGFLGGGTVGGTLGVGMDRDPASNDEQEPKVLFSLNQSPPYSSDEDEEEDGAADTAAELAAPDAHALYAEAAAYTYAAPPPAAPAAPAAMDVDDERAAEAALRREIAAVRAEREAVDAEIAKLKAEGGGTWLGGGPQLWTSPPDSERRDWHITPNDMVSEQLQELFSGREMKDGDHIVFAPGTYHLDSTIILYDLDLDAESQIFWNITLRGTGPGETIICAEEGYCLDHLFFVCREPGEDHRGQRSTVTYSGPEHPVIHFSGLKFRNGYLTRGPNAIVCALGDVDVVMEDCRVLKSRGRKSRSQNLLGKFREPMYPGVSFDWYEGGWEATCREG